MRIKAMQKIIDKIRGKKNLPSQVKLRNKIIATEGQLEQICFHIDGEDNTIEIASDVKINGRLEICIYGSNNSVTIQNNVRINNYLKILMGQNHANFGKVSNSLIEVGENSCFEAVDYVTFNSNSKCIIGKNCMFSFGVMIYNTDAHPIYSLKSNEIINKVKEINIGEHCWIGANSTILKNTKIAQDSIIGWGSVVSGKHLEPHCAIAGNPARKVKEEITWNTNGSNGYVQNVLAASEFAARGGGVKSSGSECFGGFIRRLLRKSLVFKIIEMFIDMLKMNKYLENINGYCW